MDTWKWSDWFVLWWSIILLILAALAIVPGWAAVGAWWTLQKPDWIQAGGTMLAVAASTGLWYQDRRRQAREQMQIAQLVASEISVRLATMSSTLKGLTAMWMADDSSEDYLANIKALRDSLRKVIMGFKRDTLTALVPLPRQTAHRIARSSDYLKQCERIIKNYSSGIEHGGLTPGRLKRLHNDLGKMLVLANDDLRIAAQECAIAARMGAPLAEPSTA